MKSYLIAISVLMGLLYSSSCSKNITKINSHKIIGTWVFESYNSDNTLTYTKKAEFDLLNSGYKFEDNSKLTVRQNAGGCGSPPITFENVAGSWKTIDHDDNKIELLHTYWAGDNIVKFKIIDLDNIKMITSALP